MLEKAIRIINRPKDRYIYEYEVAKFFGNSGLNEDETYEHIGYFDNREDAEKIAESVNGVIIQRFNISGKKSV